VNARAARAQLALALTVFAGACGGPGTAVVEREPRPGPHDLLVRVLPQEVAEVQRLRSTGDLETARAWVARLTAREPDHLPLACLNQDVQIEALGAESLPDLRAAAQARIEAGPDLVGLLLAARVAPDAESARVLLDRALEVAPDSAWSHYALAHLEAREGRWRVAGERVDRALLADPAHAWAWRLKTQILARGGPREQCIGELKQWIEAARGNPFFQRSEVDAARMDLAQQLLLDGESEDAREVLAQMDGSTQAGARCQQLTAAIDQAESEPEAALASARLAAEADPTDALSLVQQALLEEDWLGNPEEARQLWQSVLEVSSTRGDLAGLLLSLRARAALERLQLQERPPPAAATP
jgi:tetratricopeptide (TPR) repeat protein